MKAITLWQPWASLVVGGAKSYEFRPWCAPRALIGQRIAIHAAAKDTADEEIELLEDLQAGVWFSLGSKDLIANAVRVMDQGPNYPRAAVIGTAVLGQPRKALDVFRDVMDPDDIDPRMWAWPVSEPIKYDVPIPARGQRQFWDFVEPTEQARLV